MNGAAVTMIYDAFGNRVAKKVGNVTTTYLVEDDVNPTGLPQVFEESVNGVLQRTYTYGLQRISENQQIQGAWTPSFYGYDGFGSVRQLTGLDEKVTDTYNYDAFGNLLSSPGPTPNNYLYRGEQYDPDLGLYYLRARYYNPATGRFLSRDLKEFQPLKSWNIPVDSSKLHRYLYASGDPVNRIDPRGQEDEVDEAELTGNVNKVANSLKRTGKAVRCAIHAIKAEIAFDGNPDILMDAITGDVYLPGDPPELIGCLWDFMD
jgi:RHS repeat-associated protein